MSVLLPGFLRTLNLFSMPKPTLIIRKIFWILIVQINTEHFTLFTLSQIMLPVVITNKTTSSIRLKVTFILSMAAQTRQTDRRRRTGGHNPSRCKVLSRKTKEAILLAFNNWKSHYYGTRAWWRHINKKMGLNGRGEGGVGSRLNLGS